MRRSLAVRSLLVSSLIVLVFVIPLALLVRSTARERAVTFGRSDARALAPIVSLAGNPNVPGSVFAVAQRAKPRVVSVVFSDGSVLGAAEVLDPDPLADPVALKRARSGEAFTQRINGGVVVYEPVPRSNDTTAVVRVFVPDSQLQRGVFRSWTLLGLIGAVLVGMSVLVSDRIARSIVRSVDRLADRANRLGRGDISERVVLSGPPEVREVGVALNNLADRIDELLRTERVAVADLQHRLRTPVTALRAEVGALNSGGAKGRLELGLEELTRTIDQIIRDAAEPIRRGIGITSDVGSIVAKRFAFWEVLAEDQNRQAALRIGEGTFEVALVESDLLTMIDVLIDNVFSHTDEGAAFDVRVSGTPDLVRVSVDDRGAGVPEGFGPVRGTSGRGSTGLGLDIVRRIAESAGGRFTLSNRPGGGARALIELPRIGLPPSA